LFSYIIWISRNIWVEKEENINPIILNEYISEYLDVEEFLQTNYEIVEKYCIDDRQDKIKERINIYFNWESSLVTKILRRNFILFTKIIFLNLWTILTLFADNPNFFIKKQYRLDFLEELKKYTNFDEIQLMNPERTYFKYYWIKINRKI